MVEATQVSKLIRKYPNDQIALLGDWNLNGVEVQRIVADWLDTFRIANPRRAGPNRRGDNGRSIDHIAIEVKAGID